MEIPKELVFKEGDSIVDQAISIGWNMCRQYLLYKEGKVTRALWMNKVDENEDDEPLPVGDFPWHN